MGTPDQRVAELLTVWERPAISLADMLCDDHPDDAVAFTFMGADLSRRDLPYGALRERSERFAGGLEDLGIGRGDRVATLMGKSLDYVTALLGTWRLGAVHVPLFTAFGPEAVATRLAGSAASVVVVDREHRTKLEPSAQIPADPPWRVVTAGATGLTDGDLRFDDLLTGAARGGGAQSYAGEDVFVMLFTSGTTGAPKGVSVPVRAVAGFLSYLEYGLDLRAEDVYWNAADPGWAYGLYYTVIAPLAAGRTSLLLQSGFSAELTWRVLSHARVTNFAAAPTVYRALRSKPRPDPSPLALRCASSAGEPLNADVVAWAQAALGTPVRDHYGQTELGMAIANAWHPDVSGSLVPGSMGCSLPGWTADVLCNEQAERAPRGALGRVAIDVTRSPLMWFTGYHNAPDRTAERFSADRRWYFTADAATCTEDGHFFFSSRDDDVIIMAGYRIGPFDVENALLGHPAVAEAAVVGVPDALRGEVVEGFVVLRPGTHGSAELAGELQEHVKRRHSAHAYPRVVHFVDELPKTPSGKVQRFVLRERRRGELQAGTRATR